MEQWEIDFNWLKIQHFIKDNFKTNSLPKLDTVLFIVGLQELGQLKENFTHEEKLGIATLGTMTVLSLNGYFKTIGMDEDGWPEWEEIKPYEPLDDTSRTNELKELIIKYFETNYELENYEQEM
ncbi:MAG: hypothetical protein R2771_09610 [Saprospiraceae bacterium]